MTIARDASLLDPPPLVAQVRGWRASVGVAGLTLTLTPPLARSGSRGRAQLQTPGEAVATTLTLVVGVLALLRPSLQRESLPSARGIGSVATAHLKGGFALPGGVAA